MVVVPLPPLYPRPCPLADGPARAPLLSSLLLPRSASLLHSPLLLRRPDSTQAIIYVVDSCDVDRLGTSREEFTAILEEEELRNALVLVYANKQDLPGALSEAQVAEGLGLTALKSREWSIFKTSAIKGEGLFEGLDWLSNTLKTKRQ